jgi:lipoprotein NlpI
MACYYMLGLGYLGLGNSSAAQKQFDAVLVLDVNHLSATLHQRMI